MAAPIRVLVVDDHAIVRKGIRALLSRAHEIEVIGEAGDGAEAIDQAQRLRPDVMLMDLVMPKLDGIEAIKQIVAQQPQARILVLTSFAADDKVFPAIKAGALGYLLKDSSPDELVQAIRQVYRGEPSLDPSIARKLLQELAHPPKTAPTTDPLTERELDVLRLVAQGKSNREIAEQLVITEMTVRTHVSNILGREGVAHRINAPAVALHAGMTVADFIQCDLAYAPPFSPVWDPLLTAANQLFKKMQR